MRGLQEMSEQVKELGQGTQPGEQSTLTELEVGLDITLNDVYILINDIILFSIITLLL